ncbi:MAG: AAC(3) family N-acetyltransferase [Chloroflexota bacterium]
MLTYREMKLGFDTLRLRGRPVIVHASLRAFGPVRGGAGSLLGALLASTGGIIMPTFTYKTMVTPRVGPPHNGITYGSSEDRNRMAEIFSPAMPADRMMGRLSETLLRHPQARRTRHPILSFGGIQADAVLAAQHLFEPLAPIGELARRDGWVLLLGVDQTVNTSIHYAEMLAGRRRFVRWALTRGGVRECPNWPGCSDGFEAIAPSLEGMTHKTQIGEALVQAVPLQALFEAVIAAIAKDPLALLCQREDCERCEAVRVGAGLRPVPTAT